MGKEDAGLVMQPAHVHFIGVAGIGVSALARVALARGYQVSGSDLAATPLTMALAAAGARIYQGHAAEQVDGVDLVVISSAVREENPEMRAAMLRGIPVIKRAQMLDRLLEGYHTIAVAGTHGKTTTSALITVLLERAGLDPLAFVGGEMIDLGGNARVGEGPYAVAEADEYDASFLRLHPYIAVVTNVEPDHLDFYGDFAAVRNAFRAFMARVPADGLLVTCADDPALAESDDAPQVPRVTYSLHGRGHWNAITVTSGDRGTSFVAKGPEGQELAITLRLMGRHNVANAMAGVVIGNHLGLSAETIASALGGFRGTRRRLEYKGGDPTRAIAVYDDYAHHPTEITAVLTALRERFPGRRLRGVFQPHTYSRTRNLLREFAACFTAADEVVVTEIYAARETDTLGIGGRDLASQMEREHSAVRFFSNLEETAAYLQSSLSSGDVVVTMGAGDVWKVSDEIVRWLV